MTVLEWWIALIYRDPTPITRMSCIMLHSCFSALFSDVFAIDIHQVSQQTRANVIEDIKRTLRSGLAPDRIDGILDRYRSDLAKKVTQAEIREQLLGMPDEE